MQKTYTLAQRPQFNTELSFEMDPRPLPNLDLMTLPQAREALDIARKAGFDVIILNTQPETPEGGRIKC